MEAKHTGAGVIPKLQKLCILTGITGICFIAYAGRNALLNDLSGRRHTISQAQLQEDLDINFRGLLLVFGSLVAWLVLQGLKNSLNWRSVGDDLPVLNHFPPNITLIEGFQNQIKEAGNISEIAVEITGNSFISVDAKNNKSHEPVVLVPSGRHHMPYLLSSVQRYVGRSNNDSKEFKNFYGEIVSKNDVVVMERNAFNKHLQTVYGQFHPPVSSNSFPSSSPIRSGLRNRRNSLPQNSSVTTDTIEDAETPEAKGDRPSLH